MVYIMWIAGLSCLLPGFPAERGVSGASFPHHKDLNLLPPAGKEEGGEEETDKGEISTKKDAVVIPV